MTGASMDTAAVVKPTPAAIGVHSSSRQTSLLAIRPWMTNILLLAIGAALFQFTRQLVSEYTHFTIGFSGVSGWSATLYIVAAVLILTMPVDRWTLPIILVVAVACRLVVLFPAPHLSTDVYRYVWDGIVQHAHISPYRYVPGDPALTFLRAPHQVISDHINRRDYARTIYPPVAQMLFYLITSISPSVTFMKVAMVLFEGIIVWGLVRLLREFGLDPERTLLYAWCPMPIWEFAGSGHLDSIVIAFMVLALLARSRGQDAWTGLFLGLAVLTKFYPLVLFPALYRRGDWKMPATMAALAAATYAVYLSAGKLVFGFLGGYVQEEGMATGTRYFLLEWANHLPGLHTLSQRGYLVLAGVVFGALMFWAWQTGCRKDGGRWDFLPPTLSLAFAMMLLFSPHYPWYVAWLLPFLVLMPRWTLATYIIGLFYLCTTAMAVGYGPQQYRLNEHLYAAVALAFIMEATAFSIPAVRAWLLRAVPDPASFPILTPSSRMRSQ
jgi:alpha-1,6-mannosyltransferase